MLSDIFYTMNKIEKGMYILQEKVDSKSKWDFMRKIRCYFYVNAPIKKINSTSFAGGKIELSLRVMGNIANIATIKKQNRKDEEQNEEKFLWEILKQ